MEAKEPDLTCYECDGLVSQELCNEEVKVYDQNSGNKIGISSTQYADEEKLWENIPTIVENINKIMIVIYTK